MGIKVGNIVEIKNDTGTYKLRITSIVDGVAKGQRWNEKKGCFSKASSFSVFPETKNVKVIK